MWCLCLDPQSDEGDTFLQEHKTLCYNYSTNRSGCFREDNTSDPHPFFLFDIAKSFGPLVVWDKEKDMKDELKCWMKDEGMAIDADGSVFKRDLRGFLLKTEQAGRATKCMSQLRPTLARILKSVAFPHSPPLVQARALWAVLSQRKETLKLVDIHNAVCNLRRWPEWCSCQVRIAPGFDLWSTFEVP